MGISRFSAPAIAIPPATATEPAAANLNTSRRVHALRSITSLPFLPLDDFPGMGFSALFPGATPEPPPSGRF
ncbi:MAG: hypothetical protein Kow00109_11950 [Acidobacteriota bacterium]